MEEGIKNLPDQHLKDVVYQLLDEVEYNLDELPAKLESWYEDVMDRASGWYKRNVQKILIYVGLAIAVLFNADTVSIYNSLAKDPKASLEVAALAKQYAGENDTIQPLGAQEAKSVEELKLEIDNFVSTEIESLRDPLGIGWDNFSPMDAGPYGWFQKVLGWLVTALAISLGAPFWFDMLKRLVNIRNSGNVPAPAPPGSSQNRATISRAPRIMQRPEEKPDAAQKRKGPVG